jgi:hypothetical protein
MRNETLPNLAFRNVSLGSKETPWDLAPLLYKGAAGTRVNKVAAQIAANAFGPPLIERLDLVEKLHAVIAGDLASGGRKITALNAVENIRRFFRWIDEHDYVARTDQIESVYRDWADHLLHRVRTVKDISEETAYAQVAELGRFLDGALERNKPLLCTTRLRKPRRHIQLRSTRGEKQNLQDTFAFGCALLDICDGLSLDIYLGPLPIEISFRTGQRLVEYSMAGKRPWPHPLKSSASQRRQEKRNAAVRLDAHQNDKTLRTRWPLANLRIEAEMLIFIAQTGMNLAQAHQLRVDQYSYTSSLDGYQVRSYKHRRNGPVLFEIFGAYREIFERYLTWRRAIFLDDTAGLLFPLIRRFRHATTPPGFGRVRTSCLKINLKFISPQILRKTRVNWLLRRSRDADLTAEINQHTKETLLNVYEEPSLQVAITEISRFWKSNDPTITPPAPGFCVGSSPSAFAEIPPTATPPDCITPAGCLWCEHQRDIDSFDHVWSLCSYRHLKAEEFSAMRPAAPSKRIISPHPAEHAIERISAKLRFFKQSSQVRDQWVEEGLLRIEEGHFHPDWAGIIDGFGGQ